MADQLPLHELPWYYMAFFMCILDLNASAGWSIDTTWTALLLHGFFACVYWIWMTLLVDQELLHELPSYYMSFWSIYAVKGNCWLVYSLLHEFPSYYMAFWTHILDLNASDGWPTSTTWTPFILHGFFYVYTGFECLCWLIYRYYMSCLVTTWLFCMCILDLNDPAGWSRATTWTPLLLHEFLKHICCQRQLLAGL